MAVLPGQEAPLLLLSCYDLHQQNSFSVKSQPRHRYYCRIAGCLRGRAARANGGSIESTTPFTPSCKGVWIRNSQFSSSCVTERCVWWGAGRLEWMMDTNLPCFLSNLWNRSDDKKHAWVPGYGHGRKTSREAKNKSKNSKGIVQNIKKEAICRSMLSWGDSTTLYCCSYLKLYCIFATVAISGVW